MKISEILSESLTQPPFTHKKIDVKWIDSDEVEFSIDGEMRGYPLQIAYLRCSKRYGDWRAMSLHVDDKNRGQGIAFALFYKAYETLGPIKTSRVFSKSGLKQMKGLVRRHWATVLDGDDYLIDFGHTNKTNNEINK